MKQAKPELDFPLEWNGKLIGVNKEEVFVRIENVLTDFGFNAQVERGNVSAGGRYLTHNVTLVFEHRRIMEGVTNALAAIDGMKMVL